MCFRATCEGADPLSEARTHTLRCGVRDPARRRPHPMAGSRCATALLPEELWGAVLGFLPWSARSAPRGTPSLGWDVEMLENIIKRDLEFYQSTKKVECFLPGALNCGGLSNLVALTYQL